jgi:hypothetical protein
LYNYKILHLDIGSCHVADVKKFRKPYRDIDKTIVNFYGITREEKLNSLSTDGMKTHEEYINEKCALAKKIMNDGIFKAVANISCSDHVKAYKLATNINERWYTVPNKYVEVIGTPIRTTTTDDIIVIEGVAHIISAFGFLNIETQQYFVLKRS